MRRAPAGSAAEAVPAEVGCSASDCSQAIAEILAQDVSLWQSAPDGMACGGCDRWPGHPPLRSPPGRSEGVRGGGKAVEEEDEEQEQEQERENVVAEEAGSALSPLRSVRGEISAPFGAGGGGSRGCAERPAGAELDPDATPSLSSSRRRFTHPLSRFEHEMHHWLCDETNGSLSQMARLNMGLPQDSWERACWRALISTEHSVVSLPIRHRRRLYMLMRGILSGGEAAEAAMAPQPSPQAQPVSVPPRRLPMAGISVCSDYLVPDLGVTLGHLSVFHILHARTQYNGHGKRLPTSIAASSLAACSLAGDASSSSSSAHPLLPVPTPLVISGLD